MLTNIFEPKELFGPLKIYGVSKPESFIGYKTGWFYPLFLTRKEAIQEDLNRNGKGIYQVLTFYGRKGEFYIPESFANTGQLLDPLVYTLYEGDGAENPFKQVQNRLSILIQEQLPDFIPEQYTNFVTFLKAYYEFLEQTNEAQEILQDINKYADIDTTANYLIDRFIQNYAFDLPQSKISDNRFFIKKVREIYNKKGTEKAYKILFNILYNETISFFYPYDVVIKPSSGNWTTQYSLRIKKTNDRFNPYEFENTEIIGRNSKAKAIVKKVIRIDLTEYQVYELILENKSITGTFLNDELIDAFKTFIDGKEIFFNSPLTTEVSSIISKIDIKDGGLGYTKNHPLTITDTKGILANARVESVNRYGTITKFNIIDPGINYTKDTFINPGLPTEVLHAKYSLYRGVVTVIFPSQHGIVKGKNIQITYTGNVLSPVDNTSHRAIVLSVPDIRTIRFKYPLPE